MGTERRIKITKELKMPGQRGGMKKKKKGQRGGKGSKRG
jgi:hypothetical protein